MPHLWSSIKNKLTTYLEMKNKWPGSAQGGTGYRSAAWRRSGISPRNAAKRAAMELLESDTLQNKIDFPSIGKKM